MKILKCQNCNKDYPSVRIIDGERKTYYYRKFCFECSPPDVKNTKDISKYPRPREINGVLHKTCYQCKNELPFTDEYFYTRTKWSKNNCYCKSCSRVRKNTTILKTKTWAVEYKGGKCIICGYDKYVGALEFHHLNPNEKDFGIATGKQDKEKLKKELDKCVLVCSNCHREIHHGIIKI
jgi:hypothetical protein